MGKDDRRQRGDFGEKKFRKSKGLSHSGGEGSFFLTEEIKEKERQSPSQQKRGTRSILCGPYLADCTIVLVYFCYSPLNLYMLIL